jgi:hypothetical protein
MYIWSPVLATQEAEVTQIHTNTTMQQTQMLNKTDNNPEKLNIKQSHERKEEREESQRDG